MVDDVNDNIQDYLNDMEGNLKLIKETENYIISTGKSTFNIRTIHNIIEKQDMCIFYEFEENGQKLFFLENDFQPYPQKVIESNLKIIHTYQKLINRLHQINVILEEKIKTIKGNG